MNRICIALILALLAAPAAADYSQHPKASLLAQELAASGLYRPDEVLAILRETRQNPKLIQTERTAPERTRTWPEYRAIFMDESRLVNGLRFLREHYPELSRAQRETGVPAHVVTAIIGVETRYGGYTGPHRVIDSLATQGFDHPSRSDFFYSELKNYLLLCKEMRLDPFAQKGSYAGAMGLSQFMPSNYRKLALDYDADGQINLWTRPDAIGSTANYLKRYQPEIAGRGHGWQAGEAVAFPVEVVNLPAGLPVNQKNPTHRWADLSAHVRGLDLRLLPEQPVGLIRLDGADHAEYWLALPNFYAIMSYNPRAYYAMAVYQLSLALLKADLDS